MAPAAMRTVTAARRPFPQHMTYAAGTIRPDGPGRSQEEQDEHVTGYYDRWKTLYLAAGLPDDAGRPTQLVRFHRDATETVSEGQGYGMLIVALMAGYDPDAQTLFDGLWRFVRRHPSHIDGRLMDFHVPAGEAAECPSEEQCDDDSAFDGDADIAYALLLADAQWGSEGEVNYAAEALTLITAIRESTIGPVSNLPLLGDWVEVDGQGKNQFTPRSSDFMPGHFRAYGRFTGDPVWDAVVARCQQTVTSLQSRFSPRTGLLPDFIVRKRWRSRKPKPAPPNFLEAASDGAYSYNACRDPWRLGTDALLNSDPTSLAQTQNISRWAERATKGDPARIHGGYRLNGRPLPRSAFVTNAFVAPLAVGAMTVPTQQTWLNLLYDAVRGGDEEYYEDTLAMLALLVMTGNFWDATIPVP
jgi:endo-1,4-beta-D-glucanase Y